MGAKRKISRYLNTRIGKMVDWVSVEKTKEGEKDKVVYDLAKLLASSGLRNTASNQLVASQVVNEFIKTNKPKNDEVRNDEGRLPNVEDQADQKGR